MLKLLDCDDHFPGSGKDGLIPLLLPKINIELPVCRMAPHDPRLEGGSCFPRDLTFAIFSLHVPLQLS